MKRYVPGRIGLTSAMVLLLAACSQSAETAQPAAGEAPAVTGPAADASAAATPAAATVPTGPDQPHWRVDATSDSHYLSWGVPDSDDIGSGFHCENGSGALQVMHWADHTMPGEPGPEPRSEKTRLVLTSGAVSRTYEAEGMAEENYGGTEVMASIPLTDPVIKEFARTGVIQFGAYGDTSNLPPASTADVAALIRGCSKK